MEVDVLDLHQLFQSVNFSSMQYKYLLSGGVHHTNSSLQAVVTFCHEPYSKKREFWNEAFIIKSIRVKCSHFKNSLNESKL